MVRPERFRNSIIAAAACALGALALWTRSGPDGRPERESVSLTPSAAPSVDRNREPGSITCAVRTESGARESDTVTPLSGNAFRVLVVDSGGRPAAGIPLACGRISPDAPALLDVLVRARTDAQGSAWIALPETLPHPRASSTSRPDETLRLRAEILAEPIPEVALDPRTPREDVVLRLPPTGSVRLETVSSARSRAPLDVRFGLWARAEGEAKDVSPLPHCIAARGGVAVVDHVGIGLELRILAALENDEARAERVVAGGPRFAGEERTISVPLGPEWPTVLVRALDEKGNVLGDVALDAVVTWTRPPVSTGWNSDTSLPRRVRTDDQGRVRFPLRGTVEGGSTRKLVLTQAAGAGGVLRRAERDLSGDSSSGAEIDLGDVELRPPQDEPGEVRWASGTVVDQTGTPVRTATVLVSSTGAEGTPSRGPAQHVTVEPDGSFAVAGPRVEQCLVVRAVAPGFLRSADEVIAPGASGLRIRMQAAARWEGRVLLDANIPPESLVVEVVTAERTQRTVLSSDRVMVDGLEPGRVDVEVRVREGGWLVERWQGLATFTAGTRQDERVDRLDLRGRLQLLQLRLVGLDGTPLERVYVRVEPEPWPEGASWIRAGRLELVVPLETVAITLRPRGYQPFTAEPLDGIQEIRCSALGPSPISRPISPAPSSGSRAW